MKLPAASRRSRGFDELGLRRALSDRMLPLLVAAMAFLAALAVAGWVGSTELARQWRLGAGAALTVQVPRPAEPAAKSANPRLPTVVAMLSAAPGVASARALSDEELADLLRPWLGASAERLAVPLPAVVAVRLGPAAPDLRRLSRQLDDAAPGTLLEDHGLWIGRLNDLTRSLQACALLALGLVAAVAAAVIAVATRAGLASRREAIETVHGLGATDGFIAGRFARRATMLAATGGVIGSAASVPVLLTLAGLAAPFSGAAVTMETTSDILSALPPALWGCVVALPAATALIGFLTAQGTVRRWLRQLP